ncbi:MAG: hypothetical protein QXD03_04955 [Candidatus Anstonellales archaeon]
MPQIFKDRRNVEELIKKESITKAEVRVDTIRSFSTIELSESLNRLTQIYSVDDRIGFVLRLLRTGIKDRSYHVAIISELKKLVDELQKLAKDPDINRELFDRCMRDIQNVIRTNTWPIGYDELIRSLSEFRVKMYIIEERALMVVNEQFKRLLSEYPELYPDVPIQYTSQDEEAVRSISLSEFAQMIDLSYRLLKNLEMQRYQDARDIISKLREMMNLFIEEESENPKDIIGYAKYILSLFLKASNDQLERGKDVLKFSVVFQIVIRLFIIRLKIDYPGDSDRVKARSDLYKSK